MNLSTRLAAVAFVLIWSTGFIVARQIAGHADPNLFLAARFAWVALFFGALTIVQRSGWPDGGAAMRLVGIGALSQGLYLGTGFWAVGQGMQPGVMALLGALQPPLTALLAWRFLHERPTRWTLMGLTLGIAGVSLAMTPPLLVASDLPAGDFKQASPIGPIVVFAAIVSILSITVGTLLQRSSARAVDLVPASALQNVGALPVVLVLALLLGETRLPLDRQTLGALAWAVFVLSIGGYTLLIWLVRNGGATRASSLFFLAPPLAGILAWWLFDDHLTLLQIVGFAVALAGVILARR